MKPSSNTPQEADRVSFGIDTVSRDISSLAAASSKPGLYSLTAQDLIDLCSLGYISSAELRTFLGLPKEKE